MFVRIGLITGYGLLTIQQLLMFTAHLYGIPIFLILAGGFNPTLS